MSGGTNRSVISYDPIGSSAPETALFEKTRPNNILVGSSSKCRFRLVNLKAKLRFFGGLFLGFTSIFSPILS
jgi:hypothetical protein